MQQVERAADVTVPQTGEPAFALLGKRLDIPAHQLHEHELAELGEDAVGARALLLRLHDGEARELISPTTARGRRAADMEDARQRVQERIEGARIAAEESAYDEIGRAHV